ncbi:MAG: glycerophosphodiester phosphodiesterase family protein [Pedococcus sp.]
MTPTTLRRSLLLVVGVLLAASMVSTGASATEPASIAGLPAVVYDAHRGGGLEVRENSLSGLTRMLGSGAIQVLDLDTQELGDGTVVLMHDTTLERTTDAVGTVRSRTAATWPAIRLDTGSWLRPAPAPEPGPTLAAALDRLGGKVVLTIEAKSPASVTSIAEMVRRRGLVGSVFVNTNDPEVARTIHGLGLHSHLWRSAGQMRTDDPTRWSGFVDLLDIDILAADALITRAVRSGVPRVWAHTLVTRPQRDRALQLGVTGIITDDPLYLLGRTSTYPSSPTELAATTVPSSVQAGDRTTVRLRVGATSSGVIPGAALGVSGVVRGMARSLASGSTPVDVTASRTTPGTYSYQASVPAGSSADGRTWPAATWTGRLVVAPEDLAVTPSIASGSSRAVRIKVITRDSAATYYPGPRKEIGSARTVLGLRHARVTTEVFKGTTTSGHPLASITRAAVDTGVPDNGDGSVSFAFTAPAAGRYTVVVRQSGGWYTRTSATLAVNVR